MVIFLYTFLSDLAYFRKNEFVIFVEGWDTLNENVLTSCVSTVLSLGTSYVNVQKLVVVLERLVEDVVCTGILKV